MNFTVEGNPVWFFGITGTVKGLQNWSDTAVSSSRDASGNLRISSNANDRQSFWIVTDSGREHEVKDANVSCREGQRVTLIWGASQGIEKGNYTIFFNYNINSFTDFSTDNVEKSFKACRTTTSEDVFFLLTLLSCITIIGIPIFLITAHKIFNRTKKQAQKYIDFSKQLLKNHEFIKEIS